jgi:hypothetical protein
MKTEVRISRGPCFLNQFTQFIIILQEEQLRQQNGSHDPYSGLMTPKDKQWLINIQILQLNTQKPYVDDFYYTAFQFKEQQAKERAGERGVRVQKREQKTLEPRTYTPAQFEGSLGKLQVVSVTAPRKIIDMEIMNSENSEAQTPVRDTKKVKQTLLELERVRSDFLKAKFSTDIAVFIFSAVYGSLAIGRFSSSHVRSTPVSDGKQGRANRQDFDHSDSLCGRRGQVPGTPVRQKGQSEFKRLIKLNFVLISNVCSCYSSVCFLT